MEWPATSPTLEPVSHRKTTPNLHDKNHAYLVSGMVERTKYLKKEIDNNCNITLQVKNLTQKIKITVIYDLPQMFKPTHFSRPAPTAAILLLSSVHAMSLIGPENSGYSYLSRCSFWVVSQMRSFPDASNELKKKTAQKNICYG